VQAEIPQDIAQLKVELEAKDAEIADLKNQMIGIAMDANRKHNEQQNQLQGVEAVCLYVYRPVYPVTREKLRPTCNHFFFFFLAN
jgi:hypothetical protein